MCYYRRLILNPKYKPNKKSGGNPPVCTDERLLYIPIKCGKCQECRKQKAREWITRLNIEYKYDKSAKLTTLTFSEEAIEKLRTEIIEKR